MFRLDLSDEQASTLAQYGLCSMLNGFLFKGVKTLRSKCKMIAALKMRRWELCRAGKFAAAQSLFRIENAFRAAELCYDEITEDDIALARAALGHRRDVLRKEWREREDERERSRLLTKYYQQSKDCGEPFKMGASGSGSLSFD